VSGDVHHDHRPFHATHHPSPITIAATRNPPPSINHATTGGHSFIAAFVTITAIQITHHNSSIYLSIALRPLSIRSHRPFDRTAAIIHTIAWPFCRQTWQWKHQVQEL
jgi:hypothetical protein